MLKGRYAEGVLNRFFLSNVTTRAALPWTALFVRLKLRPNHVSLLAMLCCAAGIWVLLAAPFPLHRAAAALLLLLSLVWDHCDGQVARRTGTGSVMGGLVDSILDRFVETGWILALTLDALWHPGRTWLDWPVAAVAAAAIAATFANLYVRWSTTIKNLAPLHQLLKRAHKEAQAAGRAELRIPLGERGERLPARELGRTAGIPFYFNRDVTIWMLAAITVVPDVVLGLWLFALGHTLRAFELNWYTRNHLKDEGRAVWKVLDPDYH